MILARYVREALERGGGSLDSPVTAKREGPLVPDPGGEDLILALVTDDLHGCPTNVGRGGGSDPFDES